MDTLSPLQATRAGVLEIHWYEAGPKGGPAVFLMHGFPYDIHAYAQVAPLLAAQGCRVIVPYLRGYGPTRFLRADTPRSGEQAALGADLLALLDALDLDRAVLAGYDWGGRAACVVAALWPERCAGLVSYNNYNIFDHARAMEPDTPVNERRLWYQYYFHSERGRAGLAQHRRELTRLLWQLWSPTWRFDDATFARSAAAFDNPDFVDVVIHSYRHRYNLVPGDPAYGAIEQRLAKQPPITVPTITFDGADDGVREPSPRARTRTASRGRVRIASCPASGTTCRRKRRRCSRTRCSNSFAGRARRKRTAGRGGDPVLPGSCTARRFPVGARPPSWRHPKEAAMSIPPDALHTRTISLNTAYGQVVACEEVPPAEFPSALRRIRDRALECASGVVILDGVTHTRSAFLELVRHFNDSAARAAQLQGS